MQEITLLGKTYPAGSRLVLFIDFSMMPFADRKPTIGSLLFTVGKHTLKEHAFSSVVDVIDLTEIQKKHTKFPVQLAKSLFQEDTFDSSNYGFCINCFEVVNGIEPDADRGLCPTCNTNTALGFILALNNGWIVSE